MEEKQIYDIIMADDLQKSLDENLEYLFLFIPELMDLVGIPVLKNDSSYDRLQKCFHCLLFSVKDFEVRMALLLQDLYITDNRHLSPSNYAKKILQRLHFSCNSIFDICLILEHPSQNLNFSLQEKVLAFKDAKKKEQERYYHSLQNKSKVLKRIQ